MATNSNQSAKWNVLALANTFAVIDLVLHPLFHIWVGINPESYEKLMHLFVAGLDVHVDKGESGLVHILVGTVIEATVFWVLGATISLVYNKFASK